MYEDELVPNSKGKLVSKKRRMAALLAKDQRLAKDPDYYKKITSKGGLASSHRPMKDPEYARRAVNARWAKYRADKKISDE